MIDRETYLRRFHLALTTAEKFQNALRAGTWTDRQGEKHKLTEAERKEAPAMMLTLVKFADREITAADGQLGVIKSRRKQIVDFFAEPKKKANETWKSIVAREKFFTDKLDAIESLIKRKMLGWTHEQERIRREKEEKLRAEAEARAAEERKKILAQAKRNDTLGNESRAEQYREKAKAIKPVEVYVPVVALPKTNGLSSREVWKVEVTDKAAFVKAAAENATLQAFIEINMTGLKSLAGKIEVAGIRFYKESVLAKKL